ncbi:MAG: uroporphyrinogen-III C-methyltransferase [Pirellulaceae bacterium]|nr:uroporphyrinogen-III C-methyltransferase [Pirellulaceae bacterium]
MMPQPNDSVQPYLPDDSGEFAPNQLEEPTHAQPQAAVGRGRVYLVGAGPGDPGLLTVRGLECLRRADVVLYDGLANPALLDCAAQAQLVCVGKHGQQAIWEQTTINGRMVELAEQGKTVVRLKGGDPGVFARTAEELEALVQHGIEFEVVPGITAALAVASFAGIPLTHRDHASALALVTGQQQAGADESLDWQALAKFPGTLAIYMGVTTASQWTEELLAAGKPPDTPAAIVRRCSWSDQRIIRCRLDEVAKQLTPASRLRPPVLVIVGTVAQLGSQWNWFANRPLSGCGVWLPRAAHQSDQLAQSLTDLGARVICSPVLRIVRPDDLSELSRAVGLLKQQAIGGITFSSSNGVDGLMQFILSQGLDARLLAQVRLAAVGPATAQRLEKYGLRADVVPVSDFNAQGLVETLGGSVAGQRWLVTTTNNSRETLPQGLQRAGAQVTECLTYCSQSIDQPSAELAAGLAARQVQYAVITSSLIAQLAYNLLGERTQRVLPIALGGAVGETLNKLGWPAAATSSANTAESVAMAVSDLNDSLRDRSQTT